jgi:lipid-A-disaccharide synthase
VSSASGPLVFLIAGEPSGDLLGARLMAAMKRKSEGPIRFAGIGGDRMIAEGLESLFPLHELSLMGIAELLPRLPNLIRRLKQTAEEIRHRRPDVVVTIDAPDFCFRIAKRLKGSGIPFVHYVAPTVWAWRPGRARKIAAFLDHLLALLPFEPPYFEREGLPCTFVGHSIVEGGAASGDGARFRAGHGIAPDTRLLTVLPGSRRSEISRLLPDFKATLERLAPYHPGLLAVVPTVPHVRDTVAAEVARWPVPAILVEGDRDKYDAFAASEVALAASGTVALELALARLPAVIAYRMHPVTVGLYRRFIRVKYANLVNIMLDRMLVPEFLQENCTPDNLAGAVGKLLNDPAARQEQRDAVAEVARWLGQGGPPPSERAADVVFAILEGRISPPNVDTVSKKDGGI